MHHHPRNNIGLASITPIIGPSCFVYSLALPERCCSCAYVVNCPKSSPSFSDRSYKINLKISDSFSRKFIFRYEEVHVEEIPTVSSGKKKFLA